MARLSLCVAHDNSRFDLPPGGNGVRLLWPRPANHEIHPKSRRDAYTLSLDGRMDDLRNGTVRGNAAGAGGEPSGASSKSSGLTDEPPLPRGGVRSLPEVKAAFAGARRGENATMKNTQPYTMPRRRSKYFPDGSAIIAVKGGGTLLVESQPQYEVAGLKAKTGKSRRRRIPPLALTTS